MIYYLFLKIIVVSLIMIILILKMTKESPQKTFDQDRLKRIPQSQSNNTMNMELKMGDLPNWMFCPPAVIM